MKQYTRRDALKLFGIGTVAVAGLGLAGCSGSGEGVKNASEPVPASQAFGQAGVWMVYDGDKADRKGRGNRGSPILRRNGNVASYQCKSLTFGDLDGLSDDKIVELAKQQDEAAFNAAKQAAIDATDEAIQAWQQCYDTLKAEADAGTYDSIDYYGDYGIENMCPRKTEPRSSRRTRPRWTTRRMLSTLQTKDRHSMKLPLIKNPEAKPHTLRLETDGSGNAAANESLVFQLAKFSFYQANINADENDLTSDRTRFRILNDYGWDNNAEIPDSAFSSTKSPSNSAHPPTRPPRPSMARPSAVTRPRHRRERGARGLHVGHPRCRRDRGGLGNRYARI